MQTRANRFLPKLEGMIKGNPRFFAAIRSTNANCRGFIRHLPSLEEEFRACCRAQLPIQVLWGEGDSIVPVEHCHQLEATAKEENASCSVTIFPECNHNVFYADNQPADVAEEILRFCRNVKK